MAAQNPRDYLVITATGDDRIGLVQKLTSRLAKANCNIEESRMALLGGQFAVVMLVSGRWDALSKLENKLPSIGKDLGLAILCKRTRQTEYGKSVIPYQVEVVAMDHPGIVHKLADFFANRGINIEDVNTNTYPAPHTGTPMFSVTMRVGVPASTHISGLRGDFFEYCDELNLDATFEPPRA